MVKQLTYWSISPQVMTEEAEKLGLSVEILSYEKNFYKISSQEKTLFFKGMDFWKNSSFGLKIANDKELTYRFLDVFSIKIPKTLYAQKDNYKNFLVQNSEKIIFPLVVKPVDEAHWEGVYMNISSHWELEKILKNAFEKYNTLIIQEQIRGDEARILVYNHKVLTAYKRLPPTITGDGIHSIQQLIEIENSTNPLRGDGYNLPLTKIHIDEELKRHIQKQWYALEKILPNNISLQLRGNSNIGTGGTSQEITHLLSPEISRICEESSRKLWLNFCGIDIMSENFSSNNKDDFTIIEVNANPGIGWIREMLSVNPAKIILTDLFNL